MLKRPGLSLLELLVVIAIIAVTLGLLLAGVQAVRSAAARADCQNRLRQLGIAAHNHHATHRQFPEGVAYPFAKSDAEAERTHAGLSWQTTLLPHLEQEALWRQAWDAHRAQPSATAM